MQTAAGGEEEFLGAEKERVQREGKLRRGQLVLLEAAKTEAAKLIAQEQFEVALPQAREALRLATAVFGDSSLDLVPTQFILAQAYIGHGKLSHASDLLAMASWCVLKNPDCSHSARSQLHRNYGRLYAAQGKTTEALRQFANDIYYAALESGPEHVNAAPGYFLMGASFHAQGRVEQGLAFFDKVVDVWYKFLASVRTHADEVDAMDEAQLAEAMAMLEHITRVRTKFLGEYHIATGETHYTLGLLHLFVGENDKAQRFVDLAAEIYKQHLGAEHPSTRDVERVRTHLAELAAPGEHAAESPGSRAGVP